MVKRKKNQRDLSVYIGVNSADRGFSLIEILVSIGIVSVGIIAIVSLFNVNLRDEIRSKNKLTAIYLAQEALEVVRQQRDSNWKVSVDWDDELDKLLTNHEGIIGLEVNVNDIRDGWEVSKVTGLPAAQKKQKMKVYENITESYYAQSYNTDLSALPANWNDTGFERWLTINNDCGADCLTVTAFVSHPGFSPDIQASTRIYDWKP